MAWWGYALISAFAAAMTAILAKVGTQGVPSNLATAIRTLVVLVLSVGIVLSTREYQSLPALKARSLVFLGLSGVATGISWLAYFRALQLAPASRVAPIDKLSLGLTILFAALFLGEQVPWQVAVGSALIICGALLTLLA